ncbi:hypothetical protein BT69DRAFT_1267918 [Atractiella rhizophila]|nr:hypothetical protein BT69DRAFT_1267918 [Atractiella rhizophila]
MASARTALPPLSKGVGHLFSTTSSASASALPSSSLSSTPNSTPVPGGEEGRPENHVRFEKMMRAYEAGYTPYTGNPYLLSHVATKQVPITHGLLVGRLQFRSHYTMGLDFFVDFARRVAHAFNIPCSGMAYLPLRTEKETVLKGPFVHKKTQENYWRRTYGRALAVYDADEEVVRRWHAYLRKHQFPGIGMKAQLFRYKEVGWMDAAEDLESGVRAKTDEERIQQQVDELIPQLEMEAGLNPSSSTTSSSSTPTKSIFHPILPPNTPSAVSRTSVPPLSPFEAAPGGHWDREGFFVPSPRSPHATPGYTEAKDALLKAYKEQKDSLPRMQDLSPEDQITSDDLGPNETLTSGYQHDLLERATNTVLSSPLPSEEILDGLAEFELPEFSHASLLDKAAESIMKFKEEGAEPTFNEVDPFKDVQLPKSPGFELDQLTTDPYLPPLDVPTDKEIVSMTDADPAQLREVKEMVDDYERLRKVVNEGIVETDKTTLREMAKEVRRAIGVDEDKYPWEEEDGQEESKDVKSGVEGKKKDRKIGKVTTR